MIPRTRPSYTPAELYAALGAKEDDPARFEKELADFFQMRHAFVFPYGRSAIHATLRALELRGDVVQPAYNCVVVAHATLLADCQPVFVDSQRHDPNQDPQEMADAVTAQTVAVIPTATFGWSFDPEALCAAIRRRNPRAVILMDCCQAFDAAFQSRALAQSGDAAVLAFGIGKPITALFGGALLTNRDDIAARVCAYRDATFGAPRFDATARLWMYFLATWLALAEPFVGFTDWLEQNDTPLRRYLFRLRAREAIRLPADNQTDLAPMSAAIGRAQLRRANALGERRRVIAARYRAELQGLPGFEIEDWLSGSSFAIFAVRLRQSERRAAFLDYLRRAGVQGDTNLSYVVPALKCYTELGFRGEEYPYALDWARRVINLPGYPALTDTKVERVCDALRQANEVLRE